MQSQTHALLDPHASTRRLTTLIRELEAHGCRLPLTQRKDLLVLELAQCDLTWVAEGGLETLFGRYHDIAVWCPDLHGDLTR